MFVLVSRHSLTVAKLPLPKVFSIIYWFIIYFLVFNLNLWMLVVEVTEDSRRVGCLRRTFFVGEAEFSVFNIKIFDDLNLFFWLAETEEEIEIGVSTESSLFTNFFIEKGAKVFYFKLTIASELQFLLIFFKIFYLL